MKRFYAVLLTITACLCCTAYPSATSAESDNYVTATDRGASTAVSPTVQPTVNDDPNSEEEVFEARVIQVIESRPTEKDGRWMVQQDLKLKGIDGPWRDKEFIYHGIGEVEVFGSNTYTVGDRVLVQRSVDPENGEDIFFVVDFVRRGWLFFFAALFCLIVISIAGIKGMRALLSLVISFGIIMGAIVPLIINGWPPLPVAVVGSTVVFIAMVYMTEGINRKSHLAIASIGTSLILVGIASVTVTWLTRLTGMAQEETMFLTGLTAHAINFKGLLLAGMIIGALGVLDDIVIGQIESVAQLKEANPYLPWTKVFAMSMHVGNAHMGSMVNTLFLAYAGASLPLLMLFSIKQPPFVTFSQAVNNELVATEIARTLVGSVGIALAMPIATYLAARFLPSPGRK